jgi:2-polyprenyl-3-methyl-5-hydroxy-6-metoxy-1,4-benzoquinol methylase
MDNNDVGFEILTSISHAKKFNEFMGESILPYLKGDVLEIGSGTGNMSEFFLSKNISLSLSDIEDKYCQILEKRFRKKAIRLDISSEALFDDFPSLENNFDSVFALNVIEHIENNNITIKNCNQLLRKNGTLVILVPAFNFLYSKTDIELGHFRRYSKKLLQETISPHFSIEKIFYFNSFGTLGWFVNGKIFNRSKISVNQMILYDKLTPFIKYFDIVFSSFFGLSIVCIAKKK